jgi:hypothetical protein
VTDLWPEDIGRLPADKKAPVAILKEQAAALGKRTSNIVEAEVEARSAAFGAFRHDFYLVGPFLNDYRYRLFWISNGINLYPVKVDFEGFENHSASARTEEELKQLLRKIFESDKTRRVIAAIYAQSD